VTTEVERLEADFADLELLAGGILRGLVLRQALILPRGGRLTRLPSVK